MPTLSPVPAASSAVVSNLAKHSGAMELWPRRKRRCVAMVRKPAQVRVDFVEPPLYRVSAAMLRLTLEPELDLASLGPLPHSTVLIELVDCGEPHVVLARALMDGTVVAQSHRPRGRLDWHAWPVLEIEPDGRWRAAMLDYTAPSITAAERSAMFRTGSDATAAVIALRAWAV